MAGCARHLSHSPWAIVQRPSGQLRIRAARGLHLSEPCLSSNLRNSATSCGTIERSAPSSARPASIPMPQLSLTSPRAHHGSTPHTSGIQGHQREYSPRLVMSKPNPDLMNIRDQELRRVHDRLPAFPQKSALLFNPLRQQEAGPYTSNCAPSRSGGRG